MAYDAKWIEGADKYGKKVGRNVYEQMMAGGEWTTSNMSSVVGGSSIGDPLGTGADPEGRSFYFNLGSGTYITKTLPGNYARLIHGFTYRRDAASTQDWALQFLDGATVQCELRFQLSTGKILLYRGDSATLLHTSTESIAAVNDVCVELDITFSNTAAIAKVWIDGTLTSIDLTALDLCSNANEYANVLKWISKGNNARFYLDHMYLHMFTAGGSGDTPLLTNPFVETQRASAEGATNDFLITSLLVAPNNDNEYLATTENSSSNFIHLRKITVPAGGNIDALKFLPATTQVYKPVVYSDNAGSPDALLEDGPDCAGVVNTETTAALDAPLAVNSGDVVWVGFMCGPNAGLRLIGSNNSGGFPDSASMSRTYSLGPPATFVNGNQGKDFWFAALMTGFDATADNTLVAGCTHPRADCHLTGSGSTSVDIYSFPELSEDPETIHSVTLKALVAASGGETIDLQMRDVSTGDGDNPAIAPGAGITYKASDFTTDPDTSAAWTKSGLDDADSAVEIN